MIKWFAFLCVVTVLISCEEKTETVDFSEIAPVSDRYGKDQPQETIQPQGDDRPKESSFLKIADTLLPDARWKIWDTTLFADRFGPKFNEKFFLISPKDSMTLQHYQFKDSLRTKNAFFNYLDCFGVRCKSYLIGDNLRIPKRNGLILIGEKDIYILEGNSKLNEPAVRQSLQKDPKKENWIYIISIPKAGKTVWKRVEKGEEKLITKTL